MGDAFEPKAAPRQLKVRVKTAKKRSLASARWLERQLNDPYVAAAKRDGYRSRAAYKLLQMNEKYGFLKPGSVVVDLGAAPGGWSQVAAEIVGATAGRGQVIGLDILPVEPIPGVTLITLDFTEDAAPEAILAALDGGKADCVLSDMAQPATGHKRTDHLRIMSLLELAYDFARQITANDGAFLAKVLQGGTESHLLSQIKCDFTTVRHLKPKASRADSAEMYVLATGFRGPALGPQDEAGA